MEEHGIVIIKDFDAEIPCDGRVTVQESSDACGGGKGFWSFYRSVLKLREGLVKRDVAGGIGSPSCGRGVEMGGLEDFEFGWVDGLGVSYQLVDTIYGVRWEGGFFPFFFFFFLFIRMRFHVLVLLFVGHSGIWNGVA